MVVNDENRVIYTTKAWPRGQSSVASTVPKQIRAIKGAGDPESLVLHWSINPETGTVEVKFDHENGGDSGDAE